MLVSIIFLAVCLSPVIPLLLGLKSFSLTFFTRDSFHLLFNALTLALLATLIAALLAIPYSYWLMKTNLPFRRILTACAVLPMLIPPYIKAIGWIAMTGRQGFLCRLLHWHIDIFNLTGAAFILGTTYFPVIMLLMAFSMSFYDPNLEEAAILHKSPANVFRSVIFPLSFNSLFLGLLLVFILSFTNFNIPALLGLKVYTVEIFSYFEAFGDFNQVFIASLPSMALLLILIILLGFLSTRIPKSCIAENIHSHKIHLRYPVIPLTVIFLILLLSVLLPSIGLFVKTQALRAIPKAIALSGHELINSFAFSLVGTVLIVCVAVVIATILIRMENYSHFLIPLVLPGTLSAIGLITIFNRPWLSVIYKTPAILVISYLLKFLPITVVGIAFYMKKVHPSLLESGWCVKNEKSVLLRVTYPLINNSVFLVGLLVFAFCLGELDSTALLIAPGTATIPLKIFNLMHYGADNVVASLCLVIIVASTTVFAGMSLILKYARY
jgi:iron(III) transport system permease protein